MDVVGCAGEGKKRWLAYNLLGGISSREDDDLCAVEVSFHDATQHRRVPLLTDFYHFSMASLSAAVASPANLTDAMSPRMAVTANQKSKLPAPNSRRMAC